MKNYDERIESIFRKYDEKLEAKRRKMTVIRRVAFSISCLCAAVIVAVFAIKMPDNDHFEHSDIIVATSSFVEETSSAFSESSSYMNATTTMSNGKRTEKATSVSTITSETISQTVRTSSDKNSEKSTYVKTNTTAGTHEQHTTETRRPVVQTTTTKVTYNISSEWNEVEIDSRIGRVSNMYKPFDLDSVIEETDLVFSGTVIDRKEYEVKWTDENGENWGPYRNAVIEVKINDVYYGNTDKETIKIYYPQSLSTLYTGAFLLKQDQEYIFLANNFDEDYYEMKASNPHDRFEQEKYADIYITNSRDAIMPVINNIVSVYNGYFNSNEVALEKALSKENVLDNIPDEIQKANGFLFYNSYDVIELLINLFNE
ncbi:MAG: hypothetical protein IKH96_12055 [Ruminococcus sp.]|uniref:hypothetical protein n=1 Tax=Ruminococcus sp. TaxID=41978 RepID=UPI0025F4548F|nr:hypothetical protein [Ruminococcus sp.]MBR6996727.1 hypothetical protein [Ruminococcus sp.]